MVALAEAERVLGRSIEREYNLGDLLRRPGISYEVLMSLNDGAMASAECTPAALGDAYGAVIEQLELGAKYAGYIDRQNDEVERAAQYENLPLPADFDFMQVGALSIEARQKLNRHKPATLGQASRISGITPAAISLLLVHLKKRHFSRMAAPAVEPAAHG